jgi:hypothetical protein
MKLSVGHGNVILTKITPGIRFVLLEMIIMLDNSRNSLSLIKAQG